MFIVVDPIGIVPLYIGLTSRIPQEKKNGIIRKAILISFFVLLGFVLLGKKFLELLHIEPGSFFIAGGIMLFIIAMEMLFGKTPHAKTSKKENRESDGSESQSIAVFPLAIPMLAGPGSFTTIILYAGGYSSGIYDFSTIETAAMLIVSIVLVLVIAGVVFKASDFILKLLGATGVSVLERVMGLILAGMSVQFVYDGILSLGFLP